jgi:hypothetical protein
MPHGTPLAVLLQALQAWVQGIAQRLAQQMKPHTARWGKTTSHGETSTSGFPSCFFSSYR